MAPVSGSSQLKEGKLEIALTEGLFPGAVLPDLDGWAREALKPQKGKLVWPESKTNRSTLETNKGVCVCVSD